MSMFVVKPEKITIKPHPNADALELAQIGDYVSVVKIGQYKTGDIALYVPEAALIPEIILKAYGFWNFEKNIGLLAGAKSNRVKAIKLRGELSQGIILPLDKVDNTLFFSMPTDDGIGVMIVIDDLDKDYAADLGIEKYEPPIPVSMAGEVFNAGQNITVNYDIENIKGWPDVFTEEEQVIVTEKLHGTFCQIAVISDVCDNSLIQIHNDMIVVEINDRKVYFAIASKGLGAQGLCFKQNENNKNNLYLRTVSKYLQNIAEYTIKVNMNVPYVICGEIFGCGVQDLHYGFKNGITEFRVFDIYVGTRGCGMWLPHQMLENTVNNLKLTMVPILYTGQFSKEYIKELSQHTKSVFDKNQIREGVVIKPQFERQFGKLGRVILKSINEDYLLRKGNATEFN